MRFPVLRSRWQLAVACSTLLAFPTTIAFGQRTTAIDAALDSIFAPLSGSQSPGCAVAAELRGQRVLLRTYGLADVDRMVPITATTVFDAGSLSKQFTAAAILLLARDGKLSLDDDIRKFVPEVPEYGSTITIQHLLTHTNGLRDWNNVAFLGGLSVQRVDEFLALVRRQRDVNFAPGEQFLYSNTAFALGAIIVARVSGEPFPEFTRNRIFTPLGMTSTGWRGSAPATQALAYRKGAAGFERYMPTSEVIGSAGLLTTVGDLLRWNTALDSARLGQGVTTELQREARLNDGRRTSYARGLFVGRYRGFEEIHHDGGDYGYRAWSGRYGEAGLSVVLLCNTLVGDVVALGRRVADHFLLGLRPKDATDPQPPQPSVEGTKLRPGEAARLAGAFISDQLGLPLFLTADGDRLNVEGSFATRVSDSRFRVAWAEIVFQNEDVIRLLKNEADRQTLRRVPGPRPTAAELAALAGRYHSPDVGVTYVAEPSDSTLVLRLDDRPTYRFTFKPIGRDAFQAGGTIARVWRDSQGLPSALVLTTSRVHELRFDHVR